MRAFKHIAWSANLTYGERAQVSHTHTHSPMRRELGLLCILGNCTAAQSSLLKSKLISELVGPHECESGARREHKPSHGPRKEHGGSPRTLPPAGATCREGAPALADASKGRPAREAGISRNFSPADCRGAGCRSPRSRRVRVGRRPPPSARLAPSPGPLPVTPARDLAPRPP